MRHLHETILSAIPEADVTMWEYGGTLIGYGSYDYSDSRGRPTGRWFSVGLANRKGYISLFSMGQRAGGYLVEAIHDQLPRHEDRPKLPEHHPPRVDRRRRGQGPGARLLRPVQGRVPAPLDLVGRVLTEGVEESGEQLEAELRAAALVVEDLAGRRVAVAGSQADVPATHRGELARPGGQEGALELGELLVIRDVDPQVEGA